MDAVNLDACRLVDPACAPALRRVVLWSVTSTFPRECHRDGRAPACRPDDRREVRRGPDSDICPVWRIHRPGARRPLVGSGNGCVAATSLDGGRPTVRPGCSTRHRYRSPDTATEEPTFRHHGPTQARHPVVHWHEHVESRMRGQLARPVRRCGPGRQTSGNADTAPWSDPTRIRRSISDTTIGVRKGTSLRWRPR